MRLVACQTYARKYPYPMPRPSSIRCIRLYIDLAYCDFKEIRVKREVKRKGRSVENPLKLFLISSCMYRDATPHTMTAVARICYVHGTYVCLFRCMCIYIQYVHMFHTRFTSDIVWLLLNLLSLLNALKRIAWYQNGCVSANWASTCEASSVALKP